MSIATTRAGYDEARAWSTSGTQSQAQSQSWPRTLLAVVVRSFSGAVSGPFATSRVRTKTKPRKRSKRELDPAQLLINP
jgi:hypothetical protein